MGETFRFFPHSSAFLFKESGVRSQELINHEETKNTKEEGSYSITNN
jgi:hypothetical protein